MNRRSWRTPLVVLACGTAVLLLSFGLRQNLGLYMAPISSDLGWGRGVLAFAIALQSLVWGVSTPFFGFLADRFGPARVVALGGILYTAGLLEVAVASRPLDATIGVGVLTGLALSMTGFPIVLSVIGRWAAPAKRSLYLGLASAGGSSGQLILVPLGQWFIADHGWPTALTMIAFLAAIIVPLSFALAGGHRQAEGEVSRQPIGAALHEAGAHTGYKLLTTGYFVCGFQTMFIGAHLPAYLTDLGHSPWLGANALALIGGFNVIGCIVWGKMGDRFPKQYLLSVLYFLRAVIMAAFMLTPMSPTSVLVFAATIGLAWLGTIPLTTGLVVEIFGTRYMATLVGITFLSHQLGSFLGIWGGGIVYDATGSYDLIFWGGVVLGIAAAAVHLPIDSTPLPRGSAVEVTAAPARP